MPVLSCGSTVDHWRSPATARSTDGLTYRPGGPSPAEFLAVEKKIRDLENEAGTVIRELQAFGVDAGLFKLNGD